MSTTAIVAAILAAIFALYIRSKILQNRYQHAADSFVDDIYGGRNGKPDVIVAFSYGTPAFTLKFQNIRDKDRALSDGSTSKFIDKVQELCGHLRPRGELFDARQAVAIHSEEEIQQWQEQAREYRSREKSEGDT